MDFNNFFRVFDDTIKTPKTRREAVERCFEFYQAGQRAEKERIEKILIKIIQ